MVGAFGYERERGVGYHRLLDDLELRVMAPHVAHRRVLEVGCGTGLILSRLEALASDAWGLDLSPGMLRAAKQRGLKVVQGSATLVKEPDQQYLEFIGEQATPFMGPPRRGLSMSGS